MVNSEQDKIIKVRQLLTDIDMTPLEAIEKLSEIDTNKEAIYEIFESDTLKRKIKKLEGLYNYRKMTFREMQRLLWLTGKIDIGSGHDIKSSKEIEKIKQYYKEKTNSALKSQHMMIDMKNKE